MIFGQLRKFSVRRDDGITEVLGINFLLHTDQTRNLISAVSFDDIDAGMCMATGTDQNRFVFAHIVPVERVMKLQKSQAYPACQIYQLVEPAKTVDTDQQRCQ